MPRPAEPYTQEQRELILGHEGLLMVAEIAEIAKLTRSRVRELLRAVKAVDVDLVTRAYRYAPVDVDAVLGARYGLGSGRGSEREITAKERVRLVKAWAAVPVDPTRGSSGRNFRSNAGFAFGALVRELWVDGVRYTEMAEAIGLSRERMTQIGRNA